MATLSGLLYNCEKAASAVGGMNGMTREKTSPDLMGTIGRVLLFLCWFGAIAAVIDIATPLHLPISGVGYGVFRFLYYATLIGFPLCVLCLWNATRSRLEGIGLILYAPFYMCQFLGFALVHLAH